MKKVFYFLIFSFIFCGFLVFAQEENLEGITFPIPELGNCASKEECKSYCDLSENMGPCLDFAQAHNLLPQEEIEKGKKILEAGLTGGPGGCLGQAECKAYCDDINHLKECIAFAKEHGLIPLEELEEAEKVLAAIEKGITPPPCNSKLECDTYCSLPENMEVCLTFAEAAGLIPPEELEEAKKVLEAIKKGAKPPPCKGKAECDIYCEQPEHLEECIDFAVAAGFISQEEAEMIKKTGGKGPGGCRGEEECKAYCEDPDHMKECIEFAVQYGFISQEEAEQALKMLEAGLTSGPGGCQGQGECETYCDDLSHMEECIDFAVKAGFMTPEEGENAKKMAELGITTGPGGCQSKEECEAFCNNPDNMEECAEFAVMIGEMTPEEKEKMLKGGPGGCRSKEECEAYCENPSNAKECIEFSVQEGYMSSEEAEMIIKEMEEGPPGEMPPPGEEFYGPGGCKTPEECEAYCEQPEHFEECQQFFKPSEGPVIETPPPEGYYYGPPPEEMKPPEEYMPPEEMMPPEGYPMPPEGKMPTPEEFTPVVPAEPQEVMPAEETPQSLLDLFRLFLGNIGAVFVIPE